MLCSKLLSNTSKSRLLMHCNICNILELCRIAKTEINTSTSPNFRNEDLLKLKLMTKTSTPTLPAISSSTFDAQTRGKCKHENIFEPDSYTNDRFNPFNSINTTTTMSTLSLNTSAVCSIRNQQ